MNAATRPPVRLLVCGNVDRNDDGAAVWAASHLLPGGGVDDIAGVEVRHCQQLDVDDLAAANGSPLVIVDAAIGVAAGKVVTLTFDELLAASHPARPHSSHALPIAQVIGVARTLSAAPVDGLFVGIGVADLGFGCSLSAPVRAAMPEFVVAIDRALMHVASRVPQPVA